MHNRIKDILRQRLILKNLILKNLKGKYAGTALGIFWAVLNPLLLSAVIAFVFTEILKMNIRNFYLFIISGMLPWSFLSGSLQEASTSITGNSNLLKQFSFPRELIPAAAVLANFINLLIGLAAVIPFFAALNPRILMFLPLIIPVALLQLGFTLGLGFALSALYVRFRDIGQFLSILLMFWLWLTPVFYDIGMIPGKYRFLFSFNPATPFISLYRGVLIDPRILELKSFVVGAVVSLSVLYLGGLIFAKQKSDFLKRI